MLQSKLQQPDTSLSKNTTRFIIPSVLLFCLGFALRLPFGSQVVSEWDAGNFALAVEHYDVQLEQPHMPGTFVIFIFLARLFNHFLNEPTTSLVMVSVTASGLAAAMLYVLATTWFNARIGWTSAILMLSGPLVWYYGEMPLSYMAEFFWVLLIVYAAYQTGNGDKVGLFVLALLMGLAGGIRPNTPFFLLPLALVAVIRGLSTRRFNLKQVAIAAMVGLVSLASWMLPLFYVSGGFPQYWQLAMAWMEGHQGDTDSLRAVIDNLIFLLKTILMGIGVAVFPLLWMLARSRLNLLALLRRSWRSQVLALWIIPGAMYFCFVHLQRQGHSFTIMPAFFVLSGLAIVWTAKRLQNPYAWLILTTTLVSINGLFFLVGPDLRTLTSIRQFDAKYSERIAFVRTQFPPETTAVLAQKHYGRLPDVHLPEYQEPHLSRRVEEEPLVLAPHVRTLVLIDNKVFREPGQDEGFQELTLPSGGSIRYRTWSPQQQLQVTKYTSELILAQP